jgi:hypothetical protein
MSDANEQISVLACADPLLLNYVDRGLAIKAESGHSTTATSSRQLAVAGYCEYQLEKGTEKFKAALSVEKQKELREWLTILIKACEFKTPLVLPGDQYLQVKAVESWREIQLIGRVGMRRICLIDGEGDKARFEVNLIGASLCGNEALKHASTGSEHFFIYKPVLIERAIMASIGLAV